MSELTVYCFIGKKDTYLGKPKSLGGLYYTFKDTHYNLGMALEDNVSPVEALGLLFGNLIKRIKALPESPEVIKFFMSPTNRAEDEQALIIRLIETASDYDTVIDSLKTNKKLDPSLVRGLLNIALGLKELKTSCYELEVGKKESKTSISGVLRADANAARAYYFSSAKLIDEEITEKETKQRTKLKPKLLVDKLIFNWKTDNTLSDGLGKVYFTGNGELENKTPKGLKTEKIIKASTVYFTGNNSRLRVLGKLSAEDRYNVVILKEEASYLTTLFEHQDKVNRQLYSVPPMVVYRMAEVFSAGVSNYIEVGDFSHLGQSNSGDLFTTTLPRKDLSYVFNPPRLAFKIKRELELNQTKLITHILGDASTLGMSVTDVTDVFFDRSNPDKPIMRKEITTSTKHLKIPDVNIPTGRTVNIKALMKYDLPERNYLSRLIKDNPKIEILTWMVDDHMVGYGFVITTDEGWVYYTSTYGARHLLRSASLKNREKAK